MLRVESLTVNYGVIPALENISFSVEEGEIVALIGANGAGKTTTLRAISGIKQKKSGQVFLDNVDITRTPAHQIVARGICQVPEGRGIFPNLSVLENLLLGAYLRKDSKEVNEDVEWVYSVFPRILERKRQLAGTLSGGELQMLAIARAMIARPRLLLLDEPSMGLSPILVGEVFDVVSKLNKDRDIAILLVEQNAMMALDISDRAYVMETGKIVSSGLSKELLLKKDIQQAYLGF